MCCTMQWGWNSTEFPEGLRRWGVWFPALRFPTNMWKGKILWGVKFTDFTPIKQWLVDILLAINVRFMDFYKGHPPPFQIQLVYSINCWRINANWITRVGSGPEPWPGWRLILVGGVAQWLKRWSLTGELSLTYAWSMVDMWPLRG